MAKSMKRPIGILLALLMIAGMFTALPLTASAEDSEASKLIAGHSLTLDGNIGINFYIDPAAAGLTADQVTRDNFSYSFAWDNGDALVDVAAQAAEPFTVEGNYIKVSCKVCAAEMTCGVKATFTLSGETASEVYSVKDYGNSVINASVSEISTVFGGAAKYNKLVPLVTNMLDYGANAQTVFGIKTDDLANAGSSYSITDVTPEMFDEAIQAANDGEEADDISALAPTFGASFKAPSLVFLSENTLRLYFEMADASFSTAGLTKWNDYYYAQVENIAAANLDMLQTFSVSGTTLHYSALDYAKALAESENADQAALAKSLYWYNQAANTYFAPGIDLSELTGDYQAQDGDVLTGTLKGNRKITVAPDAAITLRDVTITSLTASYAGITPDGNATITLEGANTVKGGNQYYPGIYALTGYTLTIDGAGSLNASSKGRGAGIGGGYKIACGNIVINGGNITATGGNASEGYAAGIGGGYTASCGTITINGGTVNATGGRAGAGIGSGYSSSSCGAITISGGTVTASGLQDRAGGAGIGSGRMSSCDSVTISGGTVYATGGQSAAGIGSGSSASCGAVTITAAVTQVTATKGKSGGTSIGKGSNGSCGTVTIEPGANVIMN